MTSLFRPEVFESRQRAWLGSIQLIRPVSLAVLTTAGTITFVRSKGALVERIEGHVLGTLEVDGERYLVAGDHKNHARTIPL